MTPQDIEAVANGAVAGIAALRVEALRLAASVASRAGSEPADFRKMLGNMRALVEAMPVERIQVGATSIPFVKQDDMIDLFELFNAPIMGAPIAPAAAAEPASYCLNCDSPMPKGCDGCFDGQDKCARTDSSAPTSAEPPMSPDGEGPLYATPDRERAASLVASEDTKRLDWLEKNSAEDVDDAQLWACWPAEHDRLRDAIDAARASAGEAQS